MVLIYVWIAYIQLSKMEKVTSTGVTGLHILYGSAVLILVVLLCPLRYQPPR